MLLMASDKTEEPRSQAIWSFIPPGRVTHGKETQGW